VELLPGQWADEDVMINTRDLMKKIEQIPITIKKYVGNGPALPVIHRL
jgi:hypothetical protein